MDIISFIKIPTDKRINFQDILNVFWDFHVLIVMVIFN